MLRSSVQNNGTRRIHRILLKSSSQEYSGSQLATAFNLKHSSTLYNQNRYFTVSNNVLLKQHENNNNNNNNNNGKGRKSLRSRNNRKKSNLENETREREIENSPKVSSTTTQVTSNSNSNNNDPQANSSSVATISIPDVYPQLLAIPLGRRPLFPGFYKSLVIKDPKVIAAVESVMKNKQPYVAIFLSKSNSDELNDEDFDMITSPDQIYDTGVFAQITNVYTSGINNSSLTLVLFPHRRIKFNSLITPRNSESTLSNAHVLPLESNKSTTTTKLPKDDHKKTSGSESKDGKETTETNKQTASVVEPINAHLLEHSASLVNVENITDDPVTDNTFVKVATGEILGVLKEISQLQPLIREQILQFSVLTGGDAFNDPAKFADFAACVCQGNPAELQKVIETTSIEDRLRRSLTLIKKELENAKLGNEISRAVDKSINKKNHEYYLMEQMKTIKKELGIDGDGKDKMIEKFKQRAAELHMPEEAHRVFEEEIAKLAHLEPAASEFNVTRNYLDWITHMPWGKKSTENFDVLHAEKVLDEDHYGLKDVKDRILEFIAVGKLRQTVEGKIICFVGPPGVGKTSIGKSIARALGREFYRFSVGGLSDVAEIKGHRRTYVGALPGKVIQALKRVNSENPLIMIDEIDKLAKGHQGDPASALLELLDPEQNNAFVDHYMDIPMDLSKILFVCTANVTDTIPAPLKDRMEIINLSGYIAEEKLAIAKKYLAPVAEKECGLENKGVVLSEEAIVELIRYWCRESGVRNLKKQIEKIYRKSALKLVRMTDNSDLKVEDTAASSSSSSDANEGTTEKDKVDEKEVSGSIQITSDNLNEFVGSPIFSSERMYETTPPGVVMGLAWTSMGGSPLYMESIVETTISSKSKPHFSRTGQMGDVMKESSSISYSFAKSFLAKRFPSNTFFERAAIHLHVPEGATPKDGPSAGISMTTSLLSLALNKSVPSDIAMTGELTLTGKVLKIGGVKEKTIAAKRSGVKRVLFPVANRAEWDELQDYVKEGIEAIFVEWYDQVFDVCFPSSSKSE